MNEHGKAFAAVGQALLESGAKTVTKFMGRNMTVRGTRVGKWDKRDKRVSFTFSVGTPNYAERKFIQACMKAQEPFPIKKLQYKFDPVRR